MFTVAHVPVVAIGITSNHEERITIFVFQQTMADASWNDDDVSSLDDGLNAPGIAFASKTQLGTTGCDA